MLVRIGLLSGRQLQLDLSAQDLARLVSWLSVGKSAVLSLPDAHLVRRYVTDVMTGGERDG